MGKLNGLRVMEIPAFRAISSGFGNPDDIFGNNHVDFKFVKQAPPYDAPDLAWFEGDEAIWIWAAKDDLTEEDIAPNKFIDFDGGIYVVGVADENEPKDCGDVYTQIMEFIINSENFELNDYPGHRVLFHRIGCDEVQKALGMAQQEIFVPVKIRI